MTSMNVTHLIGKLLKAPEFFTTSGNKRMAKITLETWKHVRIKGEVKRNAQSHTVVCFNQFALDYLENTAKVGTRIKVTGELSYDKNGKAEIVVFQYSGELGPMDSDEFEYTDTAAASNSAPSNSQTTSTAASAPANPVTSTTAKAGGGLGKLNLQRKPSTQEKDYAATPQAKRPSDEELDDEIPF